MCLVDSPGSEHREPSWGAKRIYLPKTDLPKGQPPHAYWVNSLSAAVAVKVAEVQWRTRISGGHRVGAICCSWAFFEELELLLR